MWVQPLHRLSEERDETYLPEFPVAADKPDRSASKN